MRQLGYIHVLVAGLVLLVSACTDVFQMATPEAGSGKGTTTTCQGRPIMQNIIGTWRCGQRDAIMGDTLPNSSPFTKATFKRFGTLTFDAGTYVTDPDSLFVNHVDPFGPVLYKKYSLETDDYAYPGYGEMFFVRMYAKDSRGSVLWRRAEYFKVIANECNRVHLRGDNYEMVLLRQ